MNRKYYLLILAVLFLTVSCAKNEKEAVVIKEVNQNLEMITAYKEGYEALLINDFFYAGKKFLEAELLFPQSEWAPRAALMASYAYYLQSFYAESALNLERFLKTYPNDKNLVYAHYLLAMCYYETIEDEKRDTEPLFKAKNKFNFILKEYPETDFALDAKFKLGLIDNVLASKELYLGRHYIKKGKWIAAINRFKNVIKFYDQTIYVEEALHRLVEVNYKIGLLEESQKYANLLGYNYQSSEWYEKSYKIFNQSYEYKAIKNTKKKKKKGVINKFKKLFD